MDVPMNLTIREFREIIKADESCCGLKEAGIYLNKESQITLPTKFEDKKKLEQILVAEGNDSFFIYVNQNEK